ncbi:DUF192 domain-containing protein, partial [Inhella sp. 1Y17]|nr:DUF192 domain-containing protein [Inhella proteolytica]
GRRRRLHAQAGDADLRRAALRPAVQPSNRDAGACNSRRYLTPISPFLADDGRIASLADVQPLDETSHCSKEPVRFALEMNQGWFAKRGLKPGMKLQGKPFGT